MITSWVLCPRVLKIVVGIANSIKHDQTAPL